MGEDCQKTGRIHTTELPQAPFLQPPDQRPGSALRMGQSAVALGSQPLRVRQSTVALGSSEDLAFAQWH